MIDEQAIEMQPEEVVEVVELSEEELEELRKEYEEHYAAMEDAVNELGNYLAAIANKAVTDKQWLEEEKIDDFRQWLGYRVSVDEYKGKSKAEYNITKVKCNAAIARMIDILFPVGDRNFSVDPDAENPDDNGAKTMGDRISDLMDDCNYDHEGRRAIADAAILGAGIMEGPIPSAKVNKNWKQEEGADGEVVNSLEVSVDTSFPITQHVSWWDYYPDLSVANQKDCAFEWRRNTFNIDDLQLLKMRDDFNEWAVDKMLERGPSSEEPFYLKELRDDSLPAYDAKTWTVFSGYVRVSEKAINKIMAAQSEQFEIEAENFGCHGFDEDNDLDVECVAWVSSDGDLLKIAPNPYALDKRCFRVVCVDRDPSCFLASPGIPRAMRTQQLQINNALRKIDDNSSLSSVPQCIYDPKVIEPVPTKRDGGKLTADDYVMYGGKMWRLKEAGVDVRKAIYFFKVDVNTNELMAVLNMFKEMADHVTFLPDVLAGEQSADMTKTFHGMELLANNAMVIQKRIVKDWDDNVTVPLVEGYIDYIMKFRPIRGVQGIFTANARGTSGLLMKETRARNLMNAVQMIQSNPRFDQRTDWDKLYVESLRALQVDENKVALSEEQRQAVAQNPPPPDPEMEKIKLGYEELKIKKYIADKQLETAQERTREEQVRLDALYADKEMEREFKLTAEEKKIILKARADESLMANEYLIEKTGEARIA